ncbi:MAG: glutamate racemase [Gammaproteobacteria bacterium]|nr:MAG: glutamate racemase [Gammaproteobacteria bacterium]
MKDLGPIGVFDSGIGGLSIARKIRELLPGEDILYVADTGHAPYGNRTDQYILGRSFAITDFLMSRQVKAVVVACNTATTTCIAELRARYPLPFIGVEPGVKPAVQNSKSGVVGILATAKTLVTDSFAELAKRVSGNIRVEVMPCPDLVVQIEALKLSYEEAAGLVKQYVMPLLEKGVDTIVLGCTHYTHLAPVIAEVAGPGVSIVSTEAAVASQVRRRLGCEALMIKTPQIGREEFWSNGPLELFQKQIHCLWGARARVQQF